MANKLSTTEDKNDKKMAIKKLTKKSEASDFAPAPDDNYSENNPNGGLLVDIHFLAIYDVDTLVEVINICSTTIAYYLNTINSVNVYSTFFTCEDE